MYSNEFIRIRMAKPGCWRFPQHAIRKCGDHIIKDDRDNMKSLLVLILVGLLPLTLPVGPLVPVVRIKTLLALFRFISKSRNVYAIWTNRTVITCIVKLYVHKQHTQKIATNINNNKIWGTRSGTYSPTLVYRYQHKCNVIAPDIPIEDMGHWKSKYFPHLEVFYLKFWRPRYPNGPDLHNRSRPIGTALLE